MSQATFRFRGRWKEELVVTGPDGDFLLELPMGRLTAMLPTQDAWKRQAPGWAADLWPDLRRDLEAWCLANETELVIDETATVSANYPSRFDPPPLRMNLKLWALIAVVFAVAAWMLLR